MISKYELFELWDVSLFKIPPGHPRISMWNLGRDNVIWNGRLALLEQYEDVSDDDTEDGDADNTEEKPEKLRILSSPQKLICKIEFYNMVQPNNYEDEEYDDNEVNDGYDTRLKLQLGAQDGSENSAGDPPINANGSATNGVSFATSPSPPPTPESFDSDPTNALTRSLAEGPIEYPRMWAEVWFLPQDNVYDDTIQMSSESPQYYKVVVQLPQTGYGNNLTLVALGLKFSDRSEGMLFGESINIFKRRYNDLQSDLEVDDLEQQLAKMSLQLADDEFGEFVGINA